MLRPLRAREIAQRIRTILDEEFPAGREAALSYRALAKRLGVSYSTVRRGAELLIAEGRLRSEHGRATFVVPAKPKTTAAPARSAAAPPFPRRLIAYLFHGQMNLLEQDGGYGMAYRAVMTAALKQGDAIMTVSRPDVPQVLPPPETFVRLGMRGAVLMGIFTDEMQEAWARSALPSVLVDDLPRVRGLDHVAADNRRGAESLVRRLVRLGHRRFAFIRSCVRHSETTRVATPDADSAERCRLVQLALRKHKLELPDSHVVDNFGGRAFKREPAAHRVLALSPLPTAVICSGADRATTLIRVLRGSGYEVPRDFSVCSWRAPGEDALDLSGPEIDFETMGRLAYERLHARMDGTLKRGAPRRILAPVALREGSTLGPARP